MSCENTTAMKIYAWIAFAVTSLAAVLMIVVVGFTGTTFQQRFMEMDVELPASTQFALGLTFIWIPVILLIGSTVKELTVPNKAISLLISVLVMAVLFVSFALYWASLLLPLMPLMTSVGG